MSTIFLVSISLFFINFTGTIKQKRHQDDQRWLMELSTYFMESELELEKDPLQWWHLKESQYPNLSKLAQKYLCILATSASSERVFSVAGLVSHDRRSRISPEKLDKVIFLHNNIKEI